MIQVHGLLSQQNGHSMSLTCSLQRRSHRSCTGPGRVEFGFALRTERIWLPNTIYGLKLNDRPSCSLSSWAWDGSGSPGEMLQLIRGSGGLRVALLIFRNMPCMIILLQQIKP